MYDTVYHSILRIGPSSWKRIEKSMNSRCSSSAAVFLAQRGVPVVLVEKHPGSSPHPRAIGFTARTLELFRGAGLGQRIPQVPPGLRLRRVSAESLAGAWFEESPWTPEPADAPKIAYSPCTGAALAQDG